MPWMGSHEMCSDDQSYFCEIWKRWHWILLCEML